MYNQCKAAHSQEELDEWKERWDWRQMKREIAKKDNLYSYMDSLREQFEASTCGVNVVCSIVELKQVCDVVFEIFLCVLVAL